MQEVSKWFEDNKKRITNMGKGRGEDKNPKKSIKIAKEANAKLKELLNALTAIAELNNKRKPGDQIKFSPKIFHGATAAMNVAINKLKSNRHKEIKKLHTEAGKLTRSRAAGKKHWHRGGYDWIARKKGYNTVNVIRFSSQVKLLQQNLRAAKEKMIPLADHRVAVLSNSTELNIRLGLGNIGKIFKTRRKVGGLIGIQECIIDRGVLGVGSNDGENGPETETATVAAGGQCD